MSRRGISPSARHKRWIYSALLLVFATGIAWMVLHYAVNRGAGLENVWRVIESWMLRAHGAAAMATLAVFGSMLPVHAPAAWKRKRSLGSGVSLFAGLAFLAITGWLLYYASGESVRAWSSYAHMGAGAASPLALIWHLAQLRCAARAAR